MSTIALSREVCIKSYPVLSQHIYLGRQGVQLGVDVLEPLVNVCALFAQRISPPLMMRMYLTYGIKVLGRSMNIEIKKLLGILGRQSSPQPLSFFWISCHMHLPAVGALQSSNVPATVHRLVSRHGRPGVVNPRRKYPKVADGHYPGELHDDPNYRVPFYYSANYWDNPPNVILLLR